MTSSCLSGTGICRMQLFYFNMYIHCYAFDIESTFAVLVDFLYIFVGFMHKKVTGVSVAPVFQP